MIIVSGKSRLSLSNKLLSLCTLIATLALVVGCLMMDSWLWIGLAISGGILWLVGQRQGWGWVANVELLFFVFTVVLCTLSGVSEGLMLFVLVSAICAWDLDCFNHRLRKAASIIKKDELERNHLKRLLSVIFFGSLLSVPALVMDIHLKFGWILLLGVILLVGLIWLSNQATSKNQQGN